MKKYFTIYSAFVIMAVCAVFFMRTLVRAVDYVPDDAAVSVADLQTVATSTPTGDIAGETPLGVSLVEATSSPQMIAKVASPVPVSTLTTSRYPSQFSIPSLHINAHVQLVGINAKGNMGTPNNFTDVAWYKYGVIPGDMGSAVIDGHVDNGLALAGVFKHLVDIQVGADIYVTTVGGASRHFVVTRIDTYDYTSAPVAEIFNSQSPAQIRLITCGGTWVPFGKTYDKRVVVTAVLAD